MSTESRQFQEMVREAYFSLQHQRTPCRLGFSPEEAKAYGFRCPNCGSTLKVSGNLENLYVHEKGGMQ